MRTNTSTNIGIYFFFDHLIRLDVAFREAAVATLDCASAILRYDTARRRMRVALDAERLEAWRWFR
jgi:hypothetical protein